VTGVEFIAGNDRARGKAEQNEKKRSDEATADVAFSFHGNVSPGPANMRAEQWWREACSRDANDTASFGGACNKG